VVTYARDVSATRQADLALRESEERFRRLFVANPLPMWAFDVETLEFLDVNDAALARYGYTRAEFLGLTLTDIHPHQDAPRVIECVAEDGRDEIMYRGTFRHLTRDGALVEAEVSTQEVVLGGRRRASLSPSTSRSGTRRGARTLSRRSEPRARLVARLREHPAPRGAVRGALARRLVRHRPRRGRRRLARADGRGAHRSRAGGHGP
jgi:PAS domain S-box-containing protein